MRALCGGILIFIAREDLRLHFTRRAEVAFGVAAKEPR